MTKVYIYIYDIYIGGKISVSDFISFFIFFFRLTDIDFVFTRFSFGICSEDGLER